MPHPQNINIQEENDFRKIANLIFRSYKLFILGIVTSFFIAFALNRYSIPSYIISSSILIKGSSPQQASTGSGNANQSDFLYSNLFGRNQNFQNELWIMKSYPVIEKTVRNLDLSVSYYYKGRFNFYEAYKGAPFIVYYLPSHPQPININFTISFLDSGTFNIVAESRKASFYNFEKNEITHRKEKWSFARNGKLGELIETPDLALIVEPRDTTREINNYIPFGFKFNSIPSQSAEIKNKMEFTVVDRQATVIKISC
jgi:hypothetical protein